MALERATASQADVVRRYLGAADLDELGVAALRAVLEETGAVAAVERRIDELTRAAVGALRTASIESAAADVLRELAAAATVRRE
jgi:geranylgeranyl diphosphate synthase type I